MAAKIKTVRLDQLFEISRGNKFDLNKMVRCAPSDDAVVFVGRSGERNGFAAFVKRLGHETPYPAGLITVALGGSALSSFVQARPFYTAQNIDVLTPRSEISLDVKLYYCLCIEANRFRYSTFGREANRTLRSLQVPAFESLPTWVQSTGEHALDALCNDLMTIGRGTETSD